ncbi:MAG: transporter substrate-binding domain-containing protein [Colwellia sp.]|nr:transporter substrate-binding domain-containing protein [Colwellia sp.]
MKNIKFPLTITLLPKQSPVNTTHDYQVKMLNLAMEKSNNANFKLKFTDEFASQGRGMRLLNQGDLDLIAVGPTKDREALYHAIRIPLYMGLLGYRVLVIRKDRYQEFADIRTPEQLKKLIACQAIHWPDSDILEANEYRVMRVLKFESMFTMVINGRCDYFPRAITEGYSEIKAFSAMTNNDELMVFDDIILKYKFPFYFFTSKENKEIANLLTLGLSRAVADGSLLELMENHPATHHLFPLSQWQHKQYFYLFNPLLSQKTPLNNANLWLKLEAELQ